MNSILEYLEETARRVPERVAFYDDRSSLTYAGLRKEARAMGTYLARTLPPAGIVAMVMDGHSLSGVSAMLGILYSGCAYAPLDPGMPTERLSTILTGLAPDGILVDEKGREALEKLPGGLFPVLELKHGMEVPEDDALLAQRMEALTPDSPMSVFFTSGSTGTPKGVVQTHGSYIRYTEATNRVYGFDEKTVFGSQSPFFYANCIIDLYPPIALGARVYLLPPGCLAFPNRFTRCMQEQHITELTMTPSSYLALADTVGSLPELRWVIMSGERMPWKPLRQWMDAAPNADFYNFYGSTEAFSVAVGRVTGEYAPGDLLPVGKPFREVKILFFDEDGQLCSPEQGGEMLVSSPWVSLGYHHDEERTRMSFLSDPAGCSGRFYRTGDLGRLKENGELLVMGRRDSQIKHHGYRMELGEVEAALRSLPQWQDGCVLYCRERDLLTCFWTGPMMGKALKKALREKLPGAMLPDEFIHLEQLPLTATMKLDRTALTQLQGSAADKG